MHTYIHIYMYVCNMYAVAVLEFYFWWDNIYIYIYISMYACVYVCIDTLITIFGSLLSLLLLIN